MQTKSITKAALSLHVTQPVVTRLIADLEKNLGFSLFIREKGKVIPTAEAKSFYKEVQRALDGIDRVKDFANLIKDTGSGHLQIASAPALSFALLPKTIAKFSQKYPKARISLYMHSSPTVLDLVSDDKCDIGFAMLSLRGQKFYDDTLITAPMVCAVPANHRLANLSVIFPEHLDNEKFISQSHRIDARLAVDSVFSSASIDRIINLETQISVSLIEFVKAGAGIALVDPVTAVTYPSPGVVYIPFKPEVMNDYSLLKNPNRAPSELQLAFINQFKEDLKKILPSKFLKF